MIITHDGTNHNGLFDILGKAFESLDTLNTARDTDIPAAVMSFIVQAEKRNGSLFVVVPVGISTGLSTWQSASSSLYSAVQTACQNLVVAFVQADTQSVAASYIPSLAYLIEQMATGNVTGGDHVTAPTISATVTPAGGNAGDTVLAVSLRRADGQATQHALAEVISASVTSSGATDTPTIAISGELPIVDRLASGWPNGSGGYAAIQAVSAANSLLTNGNFELDTIPNLPDSWIASPATLGVTMEISAPQQQTIVIAGTPTGGGYVLYWTNPQGLTNATGMLAWNAGASAIQTALRLIPGLAAITVTSTGTTPNLTHTAIMNGQESPATFTHANYLTGGSSPSVTNAISVAGDSIAYKGSSLIFSSDGSELTAIYQQVQSLQPAVPYMLHFWMRAVGMISAGDIAAEIVDGIGGAVINDDFGNPNSLIITASGIPTASSASYTLPFILPAEQVTAPYVRFRISTAVTAATSIYIDEAAVASSIELYAGGPWVAAFSGKNQSAYNDSWTIAVANDRGGQFQEWFNRVFNMAGNRLMLPTSGGTLISDSLIA